MNVNRRALEDALAAPLDPQSEVDEKQSPDVEQAFSFRPSLASVEWIERHRALVRDIREVIATTRKIIDATREHLDRFNSLGGSYRSSATPERRTAPEAVPEDRCGQ